MDTNSMFAFFDMISLAAGVYVLYVWYRLHAVSHGLITDLAKDAAAGVGPQHP